jgi:alpha-galactosidase
MELSHPSIENGPLSLEIDNQLNFFLTQGKDSIASGRMVMLAQGRDLLQSSVFPSIQCNHQVVSTPFGQAQRLIAVHVVNDIHLTLMIDCPKDSTGVFLIRCNIENVGSAPLTLDQILLPEIRLDTSWADLASSPLWSFQGAAVEWGQDFAFPLTPSFSRENYLGHVDNGEGGGIPLVYCWNSRLGLSLAHLETVPKDWSMPVQCRPDGVFLSLQDDHPRVIAPGGSLESLQILLSVHQGDFFNPLAQYRQLMARVGLRPAVPNAENFAPAWCSWGYEFDVTPEEVTGILPILNNLKIHWLTLDDRWFDHYGDWNPRPDTFPGGEDRLRRMVDEIHQAGSLAQLWWYPLAVEDGAGAWDSGPYGFSEILQQHTDWLILNSDGSPARNNRGLAILDPFLPQVQEYIVALTRRFIQHWGFDGHKLDNIYSVPACYNPAHHHARPEESTESFAHLYALIFETTRALKPYSVTQICPCGTPPLHTLLPFMDQAVTADPTSSAQIRQRIKFYKALLGPTAAVFGDHVELSDGGVDFASIIGAGGVPATKFIHPADPAVTSRLVEVWDLPPEKYKLWKHWMDLYATYPLARGETLNLYDIAFDQPETHLIRFAERLYYAFYSSQWQGTVELRGLDSRLYKIRDYTDGHDYGVVCGPSAHLLLSITGALLLEAAPLPEID